MDSAVASERFENEIAEFHQWREELTQSVHAYHDWLEANGHLDVQQSIRFYDLLENLNRGRLMLAFLAEFSRGKSELINALFFSNFKERLLPSDVGRTTMCPTEIFHDPKEEPYLKLLSVETRYRDESITQLKNVPVEWSKVRLNVNSAADMKKALKALADTKKVYALEARMLGLAPMLNERGEAPGEEELVEVPAWRYAMINYPHALLSNGISILDTPGLNALGMEPELTVSTIPSAHAVLFLLSIDTGVTKSDLEIWERYVKPGLPQKIAVLNKIDITWDELKTPGDIDGAINRMVETTAQHLKIPKERIFPLSAQKALVGKIKGDAELVKKSGIEALERFLADEIVPMKREILCKAVLSEIGGMMMSSRASVGKKQDANKAEIVELQGLVGKSRDVVQKLWQTITAEKNAYNAALTEYKVNHAQFNHKRAALMEMLNAQKMDATLAKSAQAIEDSWTTVALQRGMNELVKDMSEDFQAVFLASEDIKRLMQGVYNTFIEKFKFQKMKLPSLDLDPHRTKLQLLVMQTNEFVKNPVNVFGKEKHFVVKNFYNTLVKEAKRNFTDAKSQTERWVQAVVLPLEVQMKDHKNTLQSRLDNLAKINEKTSSINEQMAKVKAVEKNLQGQRDMIEGLISKVGEFAATAPGTDTATKSPVAKPGETPVELMKTTKFQAADVGATAKLETVKPAQPLISDDLMSQLAKPEPAPAPRMSPQQMEKTRMTVQQMERTQVQPEGHDSTQKLPPGHDSTVKLPPGADRTQKMAGDEDRTHRLPGTKQPETTQKMATQSGGTFKMPAQKPPEMTQPLGPGGPPKPADKPAAFNPQSTMKIPKLDPNYRPDSPAKVDPSPNTTQPLDK